VRMPVTPRPIAAAPSPTVQRVEHKRVKHGERFGASDGVGLAAIGLEAEFSVVIDGQPVKPEDVFGSPRKIIRGPLMHRVGRSYHLPTGGAVYFDTGVIEIATPAIELARGAPARAGRSLWEGIRFLRAELDHWQERRGVTVHLAGFSTHYNISFDIPSADRGAARTVEHLAYLLTYILPVPVMLLGANRRSTGIGVRPRVNRVEITADFTPDAALMIATATLIVGIVREVMTWPTFDLDQLTRHGLPVIAPFHPEKHSSRKGWVAKFSSYAANPFMTDVDEQAWQLSTGEAVSLRTVARRIADGFGGSIRRYADARSLRLIDDVLAGRRQSLLQLSDRPPEYDQVGRLCTWANLFPVRALPRSKYERVLIRAISGEPLHLDGDVYRPLRMRGWSHVVFERDRDLTKHRFSLDFLLDHLDGWEVGPKATRRLRATLRRRLER
jgi:hypothetical protein